MLMGQKECKKSFFIDSYDEIKKTKHIETKLSPYSSTLKTAQAVYFLHLDKVVYVGISSTELYNVKKGSEIGVLFEDGSSQILIFNKYNTVKSIGDFKNYRNCFTIDSKEGIESFMNKNIVKITHYSTKKTYNLKEKKSLKIKERFNCIISEVGLENIVLNEAPKIDNTFKGEERRNDEVSIVKSKKRIAYGYDCSVFIINSFDKMTGESSTSSINNIVVSDDNGVSGFGIYMARMKPFIMISITVKGAGHCIDKDEKMNVLFRNGERLELRNDSRYNCKGKFRLAFARNNMLEKLKTLEIEAVRIWTADGFVQKDFTEKNSADFIHTINCLDDY
jgi:hypothetical protein